METVSIGGVRLSEPPVKIIVPITARTLPEAYAQARRISVSAADIAEWRVDKLTQRPAIDEATRAMRRALEDKPLLATFRTAREGGAEISQEDYVALVAQAAASGADAIDIEYRLSCRQAASEIAHRAGLAVVSSWHDFASTPPTDTMIGLITDLASAGDIAKLAVMPKSPTDTARLLTACAEASCQISKPIIAIAMGNYGITSRVVGGAFGSAATFAALDEASAPGQLPLSDALALREILAGAH